MHIQVSNHKDKSLQAYSMLPQSETLCPTKSPGPIATTEPCRLRLLSPGILKASSSLGNTVSSGRVPAPAPAARQPQPRTDQRACPLPGCLHVLQPAVPAGPGPLPQLLLLRAAYLLPAGARGRGRAQRRGASDLQELQPGRRGAPTRDLCGPAGTEP